MLTKYGTIIIQVNIINILFIECTEAKANNLIESKVLLKRNRNW